MVTATPRVIAFLSGKGGSGKTTVAIAICQLLVQVGRRCMLIDVDLGTNGAAYFFQKEFTPVSMGIWESLPKVANGEVMDGERLVLEVASGFYFVPSRVNLKSKGESYDSLSISKDLFKERILLPLIEWAKKKEVSYILLDSQAGYTLASMAASEVAKTAIFVAEPDAISSDAGDNLLIQLGNSLPPERRYLVDKVDIRDVESYRNLRAVFESLNRLPPLPYDHSVREAFGSRRMPISLKRPTALLFALLETMPFLFPEIEVEIAEFRTQRTEDLFGEYDRQIQEILDQRKDSIRQLTTIRSGSARAEARRIAILLAGGGALAGFAYGLLRLVPGLPPATITAAVSFFSLAVAIFGYRMLRTRYESRAEVDTQSATLLSRIRELEGKADGIRSLLLTRSSEFLIDYAIATRSHEEERKERKTLEDTVAELEPAFPGLRRLPVESRAAAIAMITAMRPYLSDTGTSELAQEFVAARIKEDAEASREVLRAIGTALEERLKQLFAHAAQVRWGEAWDEQSMKELELSRPFSAGWTLGEALNAMETWDLHDLPRIIEYSSIQLLESFRTIRNSAVHMEGDLHSLFHGVQKERVLAPVLEALKVLTTSQ